MIRLFLLLLVAGVVFGAQLHISPWWIIAPLGLLAVAVYGSGAAHLRCPACGKAIKLGCGRCHHCGWQHTVKH